MANLQFCVTALVCLVIAHVATAEVKREKLKLKVSGRNLIVRDGIGNNDPYYEVSYSIDEGKTKTKIGTSGSVNDQKNPDWGDTFEFEFERKKNQYLYFHVYDEGGLPEADTVGRVWINVADFVDRGKFVKANLDKGGYLIIRTLDTTMDTDSNESGQLLLPSDTPQSEVLRFKLSASDLPSKDLGIFSKNGKPYVIVTYTDGLTGKEKEVGKTSKESSSSHPSWDDVITFNWHQNKHQRLHFRIYDDDDSLSSEAKLGQGWVEANDIVAHGGSYTLLLTKKGVLIITKE